MSKKSFFSLIICLIFILTIAVGCSQPAPQPAQKDPAAPTGPVVPDKNEIVIGSVSSLSGPLSPIEGAAFGPIRQMWVNDINARGGIYVKEYDKKLPIKLIEYDDTSDIGTMTRLMERLIVEDKVDFIFPPTGTAMLFAAGEVANKHEKLLIGMSGGASEIKQIIAGMPYFFSALNFSDTQMPALVNMMVDQGVESAAIVFIGDLHGVEYSGAAVPQLALAGIDVIYVKSIPPGISDMSSLIREAKAADVDAFLCFAYPDENILALMQSMELGFNPKLFLTGPGGNFGFFRDIFGDQVMEGMMSWGAWNERSSPGSKEFVDKFIPLYGEPMVDWWGHNLYWGALQFFEQAVEKAGTLDNAVVRDIVATEKFDTILGPTWFEGGMLAEECHTGEVGQWQNGKFEVIAPYDKATAKPIYPKPSWPR
ncbi:MAG: amino acid ABC transporter substrate-binding protein [Bacillota bacterium]|nr:amino acid ABC transporter substrate-binding protein [Bacillota bacterium]